MRKVLCALLAMAFLSTTTAFAASSATIGVSASVPSALELNWGMAKVDSKLTSDPADDVWTANQTSMSFGDLRHLLGDGTEAGVWFSQYYFAVFVSALTGGAKYRIRQTSAGLSSGATLLPKAFGIAGVNCWNTTTNAAMTCPTGASTGTTGPAEATNKLIYDSGTGAALQTVRVDYAIPSLPTGGGLPFTGYVSIPLSQLAGTYSGNVVISVVTY